MSLHEFNALVDSIIWTDNYPKPDIRFADLSSVFGHPCLPAIVRTVATALFIEKGQVVLGVPTRGCLWASTISAVTGIEAMYLSKQGSTPLPGRIPFVAAGTVYAESATSFNIRTTDVERLKAAHIVWVADDVCESGKTLTAVSAALRSMGCHDVRLLSLLTMGQPTAIDDLYSIIEYDIAARKCDPGRRVFGNNPRLLLTLRGSTHPSTKTLVYGPPSTTDLILSYVHAHFETSVGDIQWKFFEGGMPNITFEMPGSHHVVFIYDASFMNTIQDGVVHALARNCLETMTVIIPYLPQGTMERVDSEGILATAQTTLHSLCSNMPMTGKGPVQLRIYDLHQTGTRFYCGDKVQYVPCQVLHTIVPKTFNIIAFPDDGAAKRFKHLFPTQTLLVFSKSRKDGKRLLSLSETIGHHNIVGGTVIIVDDLTRTGGTLIETAKILKSMGASSISAAFVHADFDPGKTIPFVRCALFDTIYCTNSNPQKASALAAAASLTTATAVVVSNIFKYSLHRDFALVSSISETKIRATCLRFWLHYIFVGPVPSGVPEQPIGAEGRIGASNRSDFLKRLYPHCTAKIVSYESSIIVADDNTFVDTAYMKYYQDDQEHGGYITDGSGCSESVSVTLPSSLDLQGGTFGEYMQKKYNLSTKDSWIGHFCGTDRVNQLANIMPTKSDE